MDRIQEVQQRRNRMARNCWDLYAEHRQRVTALLLGSRFKDASRPSDGLPAPRLCVLGAGNCNDLDLPQLLTGFGEIHLVDGDGEALSSGVAAQQLSADVRLVRHPGVDVTGLSGCLSSWSCGPPPRAADVEAVLAALAGSGDLPLGGPFEAVASVCLLSQLLEAVKLAVGEAQAYYLPLVQAVRAQHLRQLVQLCCPGGRLTLVTDFVSSETCGELATAAESELPALAERLLGAHNFFTGLNPFLLRQLFVSDPWLSARVAPAQLSHPWRWRFPSRDYAVCAVTALRHCRDSI